MTDSYYKQQLGSSRKKIKCFCPRCQEYHYLNLFWTGDDEIPKKFCLKCKNMDPDWDRDFGGEEYYDSNYC